MSLRRSLGCFFHIFRMSYFGISIRVIRLAAALSAEAFCWAAISTSCKRKVCARSSSLLDNGERSFRIVAGALCVIENSCFLVRDCMYNRWSLIARDPKLGISLLLGPDFDQILIGMTKNCFHGEGCNVGGVGMYFHSWGFVRHEGEQVKMYADVLVDRVSCSSGRGAGRL